MAKMSFTILLTAALLSGCATGPRMDENTLTQLYANQRNVPPPEVTIFIPGIMGSVLKDQFTGRIVWGRMWSGALDILALPINKVTGVVGQDGLVPVRLLDSFTWAAGLIEGDIYASTQRIAMRVGGFTRGDINDPHPGENVYFFTYDWRRDFVEAAQQLDAAIQRIKTAQGKPHLKVRLLCHSAGGLVARYYVKYGALDVLDQDPLPPPTYAGAANVSRIIMLGTPNAGSFEAFQHLHAGLLLPLVGRISAKTLFTMPASYQLLPSDGTSLFVDPQGRLLPVDLYDPANWERYGWSVFAPRNVMRRSRQWLRRNPAGGRQEGDEELAGRRKFLATMLFRAKQFHRALRAGDPAEEKRRMVYVLMGADCEHTLRRAILEPTSRGWKTRFRAWHQPAKAAVSAFGDGSVTKDSLLGLCYAGDTGTELTYRLPGAHAIFFCENHFELAKNTTYLDNILHTLLEE